MTSIKHQQTSIQECRFPTLSKIGLGLSASMEYALWHGEWTSQYLAGQDQKDYDVYAARLQTT